MNADRWIRSATSGAAVAVAGFAAVVSYSHIYDLGRSHGQSGLAARLLPLSVDGLILAASLVMLHEARRDNAAPVLARSMLALGVAATVAANIAYGASWGWLGAVISAWPAVAFVGAAEMVIGLVRRHADQPVREPLRPFRAAPPPDAEHAAEAAYRASVAGGNPLSARALSERYRLSRHAAAAIRERVAAEANGHRDDAAAGSGRHRSS